MNILHSVFYDLHKRITSSMFHQRVAFPQTFFFFFIIWIIRKIYLHILRIPKLKWNDNFYRSQIYLLPSAYHFAAIQLLRDFRFVGKFFERIFILFFLARDVFNTKEMEGKNLIKLNTCACYLEMLKKK